MYLFNLEENGIILNVDSQTEKKSVEMIFIVWLIRKLQIKSHFKLHIISEAGLDLLDGWISAEVEILV